MTAPDRMHPDDLVMLADLVAERLADRLLSADRTAGPAVSPPEQAGSPETLRTGPEPLLDAKQVAARFGVTAGWVRENAERLGVIPLGDGPKPRLRFDADAVASAMTRRSGSGESEARAHPVVEANRRSRGPGNAGSVLDALPVRELQPRTTSRKVAPRRANARGLTTRDVSSPPPERTSAGTRSAARARVSQKET